MIASMMGQWTFVGSYGLPVTTLLFAVLGGRVGKQANLVSGLAFKGAFRRVSGTMKQNTLKQITISFAMYLVDDAHDDHAIH